MFRNEYTMDRKLIKEYVFNIIGKKTIIAGIIICILGILMFFLYESGFRYVMLTCSFIGLFCAIVTPIIMINQLEQTSKRLNNGKIEKTCVNFNNNIVMDEGKVHLEFEYSQIIKLIQTKNLIVLKIDKQSAILVYRYGFVKGNEKEFIEFIKDKTE